MNLYLEKLEKFIDEEFKEIPKKLRGSIRIVSFFTIVIIILIQIVITFSLMPEPNKFFLISYINFLLLMIISFFENKRFAKIASKNLKKKSDCKLFIKSNKIISY